ncbi:MAG: hypothetical protein HDR43_00555 [Mycoplasma sp.]|nr:hypothetical protein [Mycoplasma sp.]
MENESPAPTITKVETEINSDGNIEVTITGTQLTGSITLTLQNDEDSLAQNFTIEPKQDSVSATSAVLVIKPKDGQNISDLYGKTFTVEVVTNGKKGESIGTFPQDPTIDSNESLINKMIDINF